MKIIDRNFLKVNTNSCHASTIAFYQDKPVVAWFGGSMEGAADTAIYIQYDNKVVSIGEKDQIPRWNPILFAYEDKLFLFVKLGIFCDRWNSVIYDVSNIFEDNFDINKIIPQILPAGLNGPVKTKIVVKDGVIHCGSSVETIIDWSSYIERYIYDKESESLIFVSRSSPLTVPKIPYTDPYYGKKLTSGIIQPALYVDKMGVMHCFFRSSRGLGKVYYSYSKDDLNELWEPPRPTKFPNPNSSVDCVYKNGRLFLVYNPSEDKRTPLIIQELQEDTFDIIDEIVINDKVEGRTLTQELSYPYLIGHNNQLHLVYTYGRSKIEQCVISTD